MELESTHVSTYVAAAPAEVYAYASDPARLPEWAAGLADGIRQDGDRWVADSPFGEVEVRFTPANDLGVLDHKVVMPDGTVVLNPMRVVPAGEGAEVIFTVRRRPGMSAADLASDAEAVAVDLATLRRRLETGR